MTAYITRRLDRTNVRTANITFTPFYRSIACYAHRIISLIATLVMLFMVGGCKATPVTNSAANVVAPAQELQSFLFPDQAVTTATYITRARNFVENMPQTMLMLTRDQIGYMFGKPSFHRHDADVEVWQYKTAACVVDFYFYGKNQVSYIDTRHKDQTPAIASEVSSCLHTIDKKDFAGAGGVAGI
jgi:hypothetical protein